MKADHNHLESEAEWKLTALVSAAAGFPMTVGNSLGGGTTFATDLILRFLEKAEKSRQVNSRLRWLIEICGL